MTARRRRPARALHVFGVDCSATRPPEGMNEYFRAPRVPGAAKWIMTTIGRSRGAKRQVSRNRNASMTRLATKNMIAAVRETVAIVPPRMITSETHQPRPKRKARYSASGAASAKRAPSAIGCSADPRARMSPSARVVGDLACLDKKGEVLVDVVERRPSGPRLDQGQHGEHGAPATRSFTMVRTCEYVRTTLTTK